MKKYNWYDEKYDREQLQKFYELMPDLRRVSMWEDPETGCREIQFEILRRTTLGSQIIKSEKVVTIDSCSEKTE